MMPEQSRIERLKPAGTVFALAGGANDRTMLTLHTTVFIDPLETTGKDDASVTLHLKYRVLEAVKGELGL